MTSRLFAIAGWLTAGHALLFGLFWLLLSIPESNVAMLMASALTVVLMALLFGWIEAVGLLAWQGDARPRELPRRAMRAMPGVWLGTALFVGIWYLVAHAGAWWGGHQGEIDAWLMVRFGWANTGKLHVAVGWLLTFVRVVGLSVAVSLASALVAGGFGDVGRARSVRDGVSLRRLLIIGAILIVFFWLPWRGVDWRPTWVTPDWKETAFVAVKIGMIYVMANIGWALVLGGVSKRDRTSP
jgi:hypothetical protein